MYFPSNILYSYTSLPLRSFISCGNLSDQVSWSVSKSLKANFDLKWLADMCTINTKGVFWNLPINCGITVYLIVWVEMIVLRKIDHTILLGRKKSRFNNEIDTYYNQNPHTHLLAYQTKAPRLEIAHNSGFYFSY